MGQTEIKIFIILTGIIVLVFVVGVILFLFQYRQRRLVHEKEKVQMNEKHQLDLLNMQLESQRQTMEYIGQEIHDSVAQKLTLASIYAQRMEFENKTPGAAEKLTGISKIINDSLLELRQLSKNLTDNKLQNADLPQLIKMECAQVNATGICTATFEITTLPEINISVKSSLFRIIQEFIQNSIKHSGCRQIRIRIDYPDNKLIMAIEDDGKGFDIDVARNNGIGLDNIRRRIQMLGGTFDFKSEKGMGTVLNLSIPYNINN